MKLVDKNNPKYFQLKNNVLNIELTIKETLEKEKTKVE